MKKILLFTVLLTAALTACTSGPNTLEAPKEAEATVEFATSDDPANPTAGKPTLSAIPKETPADLTVTTGKYLKSKTGDGLLVIDNYGPVTFTYEADDRAILDTLKDGDSISVKTGPIAETWPGQTAIYEITLVKEGTRNDIDPATLSQLIEMGHIETSPLIQMFYARGTLFYDTGREARPTCGTEDGRFNSIIASSQIPSENGQANFGTTDDGYISMDDGAMAVKSGDAYSLFLADGTVEFDGRFFKESELSDDTLTWLDNYYSRPEEERLHTSAVPPELLLYPGSAQDSDLPPRSYQ